MDDSPPKWLADALATPAEEDMIEVRGCSIHRMAWGRRGRPGLVLVHGGAGHAHWWSFIAPLFPQYRVVALDLSGHGDSGHRSRYGIDDWTEEVLAVRIPPRYVPTLPARPPKEPNRHDKISKSPPRHEDPLTESVRFSTRYFTFSERTRSCHPPKARLHFL